MSEKRVALVTGGVGGIGTAICEALTGHGLTVVAGYHPAEEERANEWLETHRANGLDVHTAVGDVASFDSAQTMISDIEARVGPISVLVNCAGITRDKFFHKMDADQWNAVISVNLNSVFNVTRHVLPGMRDRGFGRIVNISSVNGQKGQAGQANYSAAKAGMHGVTMALAQETALKGITVNTVAPGYVATAMTEAIDEKIRNAIIETIPMRRMGRPEEIAKAVAFLCSDDAAYITGAVLPVNGGLFTAH